MVSPFLQAILDVHDQFQRNSERPCDPNFFHRLKTLGRTLGDTQLSECSAELEASDGSFSPDKLAELWRHYDRVVGEVRRKLMGRQEANARLGKELTKTATFERKSLLCVDDDSMVLETYRLVFGEDFDVTLAPSARAALAILEQRRDFDHVLCDLVMPDLNGRDFLEVLKRDHPEMAAKVVFLTGGAFESSLQEFLSTSGLPAFAKPFSPSVLRRFLTRR